MKKYLFIIIMMLPVFAFAQKSFESSVKLIGAFGVDDYKNKSVGVEAVLGYRINNYFRIGAGTGISWCNLLFEEEEYNNIFDFTDEYRESEAFVPLFVNAKANILKEGISPYFSVNVGYSFLISFSDYADKADLGLMFNPAFGVDFPLTKGSLFTEIGYKYQAMDFKGYGISKDLNHSQITISLGYNF